MKLKFARLEASRDTASAAALVFPASLPAQIHLTASAGHDESGRWGFGDLAVCDGEK